jgi:ABC-2 type transport system permease protein
MLRLLSLETRRLFRERLGWVVLVVMTLACVIAVIQGRTVMAEQQEGRAAFAAGQAEAERTLLRAIASASPATISIIPRRTSLPIVAPIPPLADFSTGRMGFEAYSTMARLGLREDALFKQTRLDNPEMLARGQVDLGFVVAVILPLLLIALGYGVFASDRDT